MHDAFGTGSVYIQGCAGIRDDGVCEIEKYGRGSLILMEPANRKSQLTKQLRPVQFPTGFDPEGSVPPPRYFSTRFLGPT